MTNEPTVKNLWHNFWEHLSNFKLIRYLLIFALGWASVQVLAYFATVIIIFIFAAITAFLLNYPVQCIGDKLSLCTRCQKAFRR